LSRVLETIKKDVRQEYESLGAKKQKLGGFLHELIHLDEDEKLEFTENVEVAKRLMSEHPSENVLLKAALFEEPAENAGLIGLVRAEDFLNFAHIEVATPHGEVFTVPRTLVREFIGVSPQAASIVMPRSAESMGGNGLKGGGLAGNEEPEPILEV
jgi:hypothetical protein